MYEIAEAEGDNGLLPLIGEVIPALRPDGERGDFGDRGERGAVRTGRKFIRDTGAPAEEGDTASTTKVSAGAVGCSCAITSVRGFLVDAQHVHLKPFRRHHAHVQIAPTKRTAPTTHKIHAYKANSSNQICGG